MNVAPFAGAWIEMQEGDAFNAKNMVAPFAGAWIEMSSSIYTSIKSLSLPSRERELKFLYSALAGACE